MSTSLTCPRCHPQLAPRSGATSSLPAAHLPSPRPCRLGYRAGLPRCAGGGVRSEGRGAGPRRRGARSSAASGAALGRAVGLCRCSPTLSSPNRHRLHQPLRSALPDPARGAARERGGRLGGHARRDVRRGARGGDHAGPSRRLRRVAGRARRLARRAWGCAPLQRSAGAWGARMRWPRSRTKMRYTSERGSRLSCSRRSSRSARRSRSRSRSPATSRARCCSPSCAGELGGAGRARELRGAGRRRAAAQGGSCA